MLGCYAAPVLLDGDIDWDQDWPSPVEAAAARARATNGFTPETLVQLAQADRPPEHALVSPVPSSWWVSRGATTDVDEDELERWRLSPEVQAEIEEAIDWALAHGKCFMWSSDPATQAAHEARVAAAKARYGT